MKVKATTASNGNHLVTTCRACITFFCTLALLGCTLATPATRFEALAEQHGLEAATVSGSGFDHRVFSAPAPETATARPSTLHVYYGSDGSPFIDGRHIARDPTPQRPLTLALMDRDPFPSVFVGRPCYHGLVDGCDARLWTVARYSPSLVESMTAATARVIEARAPARVVLVGYSGGGAFALLVAERLERVDAVVTVAANLDIAAWTDHHGYTPLHGSVDPIDLAGRREAQHHLHLSGSNDENVPPAVQRRVLEKLPPDAARIIDGFDHRCCWAAEWAGIMAEVEDDLGAFKRRNR